MGYEVCTHSTTLGVIMKPIPDKAEVALEYPDKFYIGTFERSARFDAHLDENGIALALYRSGDAQTRRSVHMHFHYALFADILRDLAKASSAKRPDDAHREALRDAAKALYLALKDTQVDLLKATSIPSSFVADEMDSCRSKRQILILDCCHSGAFARGTKGEQKAITETTF